MVQHKYGYIRVSTKNQHTDRQQIALLEKGIARENLFTDWQSGCDFKRPEYKRLLACLKPEDCVLVTSLNRLGRNYQEILEQWNMITHVKKADIIVLDMPLLNTTTSHDNLTGRFLADIVLQILSYVAEIERTNIRKRQAEGIAAAKAKGVMLGRPRKKLPKNFKETVQRIRNGEISYRKAAAELNVSHTWLYKRICTDGIKINKR
ncbi:MAG: recombinase family protein [Acidaminococcaceae bacterium]|nr:recombinase family protein [Acidaminococcaceae bacterium]